MNIRDRDQEHKLREQDHDEPTAVKTDDDQDAIRAMTPVKRQEQEVVGLRSIARGGRKGVRDHAYGNGAPLCAADAQRVLTIVKARGGVSRQALHRRRSTVSASQTCAPPAAQGSDATAHKLISAFETTRSVSSTVCEFSSAATHE